MVAITLFHYSISIFIAIFETLFVFLLFLMFYFVTGSYELWCNSSICWVLWCHWYHCLCKKLVSLYPECISLMFSCSFLNIYYVERSKLAYKQFFLSSSCLSYLSQLSSNEHLGLRGYHFSTFKCTVSRYSILLVWHFALSPVFQFDLVDSDLEIFAKGYHSTFHVQGL